MHPTPAGRSTPDMSADFASAFSIAGGAAQRRVAHRVILAFVLINVFVFGIIGVSLYQSWLQYHHEAAVNAQNLAQVLAHKLEAEISQVDLALLALAHEYRQQLSHRIDVAAIKAGISEFTRALPFIDALYLADAEGVLRYGPSEAINSRLDRSELAAFAALRNALDQGLIVSHEQTRGDAPGKTLVLARSLRGAQGGFAGIVFARLPMRYLTARFTSIDIGQNGIIALLDAQATPLEHHPDLPLAQAREALLCGAMSIAQRLHAGKPRDVFRTSQKNDACAQTIAFQPVGAYPLYVKVGLASSDYLARWHTAAARAGLVAALVALFSFAVARRLRKDWQSSETLHARLAEEEAKFRTLAEHSRDWVYWQRPDGGFVYMTPSCEAVTGLPAEAFIEHPERIKEIVHPEDRDAFCAHLGPGSARSEAGLDFRILRPDGEIRWLSHTCVPLLDAAGQPLGRLVSNRDITARKRDEIQLKHMSAAIAQSAQAIALADAAGRFTYVNPAFTRLFGYSLEEARGQSVQILQPRTPGANDGPSPAETTRQAREQGSFCGRVVRRCKDGREVPIMLNITPVMEGATLTGYVGILTDLTEIEQHQAELEYTAQHDALTGLPNRLLLRDRLQQALAQAARQNTLLAVCYLDLDGFKPINDTHGHKTGDRVLIEVAHRLLRILRSSDTVARLGGDEFVLLLVDLASTAELEHILDRLLTDLAAPYDAIAADIGLTASIGVALYPLNEGDADMLLRNADKAMYAAKQSGKNRYSFFDPSEELRARTEHEVRQRIRAALHAGEFTLHYQPKVDMRSGTVIGVEALLRWKHPEYGLRLPGSFLPFVENHELIVEIGAWVLRTALDQVRQWRAHGVEMEVSVNVAARQLQHPNFIQNLGRLLHDYPDIAPQRLELEILESAALDDIERVQRLIGECERLGVRFALDDFGTGYSSLTYLKRLPAHTLKIDQSFVRDMLEDPEDLAITEGVLGLARAFQRETVAEGVETVHHGSMLLHMGCDYAQGYGIAQPMPAEAIPGWLKSFRPAEEWLRAAELRLDREDFPLLAMEVEHRRWVGQLIQAIERRDPALLPAHVPDHRACNFGRWLLGEGHAQYYTLPEFKALIEPHREVHRIGQRLAAHLIAGEYHTAAAGIGAILAQRDRVLDALGRLQRAVIAARRAKA